MLVTNAIQLNHLTNEGVRDYLMSLLDHYKIDFYLVAPRKSKLGDYRNPKIFGKPIITINHNLDPLNFLITVFHEIAHHVTWIEYQQSVRPHGLEWQKNYCDLLQTLIDLELVEERVILFLKQHIKNPSATLNGDETLMRLHNINEGKNGIMLNQLASGMFKLDDRLFKIIQKNRTRYLCQEYNTGKRFTIHGQALVTPVK